MRTGRVRLEGRGSERPAWRLRKEQASGEGAAGEQPSKGGFIGRPILIKIFKMADGGAASQDESSAAAVAAGNHYCILHIHIHTRTRAPPPPAFPA